MVRHWLTAATLAATVLALTGCRNGPCRRRYDPPPPRPADLPDTLGAPIPPRVLPLETIPSTGVPSSPATDGGFSPIDPVRNFYTDPVPSDPPPPREVRYPPVDVRPALPGPEPGVLGEPILPVERRAEPKLLVPVPLPGAAVPDRRDTPPPAERKDLPPPLTDAPREKDPLALPGFATVLDRGPVTTSRRPELGGFAWLKEQGYKTVAYLHAPDAVDVTSARDLAAKEGLTFVAIPVAPETLPAAYKTFAALVQNADARPLHVFATSGNRSGTLWYLVFREGEVLSADAARVRAGKLGLADPTASDEAKQFWLAAQNFLSKR